MSPDPFPPEDASRSHAEGNVVDPAVLAERRAQRAELAEQVAARRAADAQSLAAELSGERARLEAELEEARREPERLSRLVAERERALRTAEQRAHAEEAQRIETAEQLAERIRRHEAELADLTARAERAEAEAAQRAAELASRAERAEAEAAQRAAELAADRERAEQAGERREEELKAMRVRLTEAEQIAAQAESARRRAELKRQSAREKRRRASEAREQAEIELATLRAEAQAAREGADAVIAQAAHEQQERDRLRAELEQVAAERSALRTELERLRAEHEAEREQARAALDDVRAERERARLAADETRAVQEREVAAARAAADEARAVQEREVAAARAAADEARAAQERGVAEARAAAERAGASTPPAAGGAWAERLRAELACARALRPAPATGLAIPSPPVAAASPTASRSVDGALTLERRLLGLRGSGLPGVTAARAATGARAIEPLRQPAAAAPGHAAPATATAGGPAPGAEDALSGSGLAPAGGGSLAARAAALGRPVAEGGRVTAPPSATRTIPVTALALERERSTRLQAQLERQAETERELREEVAELQRAVASRMDAEDRIERALRRVRGELEAANALRMLTERGSPTRPLSTGDGGAADAAPAGAADAPAAADAGQTARSSAGREPGPSASGSPAPGEVAPAVHGHDTEPPALAGFDADRLNAARARLRATTPAEEEPPADDVSYAGDVPPAADVPPTADVPPADDVSYADDLPHVAQVPSAGAPAPADAVPAPADAASASAEAAPALEDGDAPAAPLRLASTGVTVRPETEPPGPPTPWLPAALKRLLADDPDTAGRILVGMLPAHGLVTRRDLTYDLEIADRGTVAVDVRDGRAQVRPLDRPRDGQPRDFRVSATHAGLARLLLGRRRFKRRARVRGSRRRVKELRRLAQEPLALRDLAASGATLEPALALWLAALAIDPARTCGHRFTVAHAPIPGGDADAWLRIRHGEPPVVLRTRPGEEPAVTLRSTRGALLALLAGVAPPRGEAAAVVGDAAALELVRGWIRSTEFPAAALSWRGRRGRAKGAQPADAAERASE